MGNDDNEKLASTRRAIDKFCERQLQKERRELDGPKRRNQKPEKITEAECLSLMRKLGWKVQVYEAKTTYSQIARRWINQSMQAGICDCQGTMLDGRSIAIEFKAKGKLSTFWRTKNIRQQEFIIEKINLNAFACVVDSAQLLWQIFNHWQCRLVGGSLSAQNYLMEALPKKPSRYNATKSKPNPKSLPAIEQIKDHSLDYLDDPED